MRRISHKLVTFFVLLTTTGLLAAQCGAATSAPSASTLAAATQPVPSSTPVKAAEAAPTPTPADAAQVEKQSYDTVFPLPDDVQNFTGDGGESPINFQTSLSLGEVIEFYRQAFTEQGLTERTILTEISDSGFSMVFDGWPNGKAVVIQGVDFGTNINVNIRFENV
jgi:hypothetical protein